LATFRWRLSDGDSSVAAFQLLRFESAGWAATLLKVMYVYAQHRGRQRLPARSSWQREPAVRGGAVSGASSVTRPVSGWLHAVPEEAAASASAWPRRSAEITRTLQPPLQDIASAIAAPSPRHHHAVTTPSPSRRSARPALVVSRAPHVRRAV
jgi:hypothetical protein